MLRAYQRSFLARAVRKLPVMLAVVALSSVTSPVMAGTYQLWPESGSGSVSSSGSGWSYSRPLTDPDVQESVVDGSISYTFTENWRYVWEPDSDDYDDLPVDSSAQLSATVQFDFTGVSVEEPTSVSGSGSFSINGSTVSASASYPVGGPPSESNNYTPQQATFVQPLSGWEGTFSVTYAGSVAANGPIMGQILVARGPVSLMPYRYIYITGPSRGSGLPTGQHPNGGPGTAPVNVTGVWKVPFQTAPDSGNPAEFRVQLFGTFPVWGWPDPSVGLSWSNPGPIWRSWNWSRDYFSDYGNPRYFNITAELQWKTSNGQWQTDGNWMGRWWSTTWFHVYDPVNP